MCGHKQILKIAKEWRAAKDRTILLNAIWCRLSIGESKATLHTEL